MNLWTGILAYISVNNCNKIWAKEVFKIKLDKSFILQTFINDIMTGGLGGNSWSFNQRVGGSKSRQNSRQGDRKETVA